MNNNNAQVGLANVNAKADIKGCETINNQFGGKTYNNDNSISQVINQNYYINILPDLNPTEAIKTAIELGNKNAKSVGELVEKELQNLNISKEQVKEKLQNPEVLSVIAEANKTAYTESDENKQKVLANLICEKFKSNESFEQIVYSEAIKTIPKLTLFQIKLLYIVTILVYCGMPAATKEDVIQCIQEFCNDIDNTNITQTNIEHLIYSGVVERRNVFTDFKKVLNSQQANVQYNDIKDNEFVVKFEKFWNESFLKSILLTSVGKAIAITYSKSIDRPITGTENIFK